MSDQVKSALKSSVALVLAAGLVTAVALPAQAGGDGGAFAAGLIGGAALGVIAGSAAAAAAPPPPPPPPPGYYAPAYAGGYPPPPPPRCWYEPQQVWDGYAGAYVVRRVRVCQ
jgi:H+/Cl- antiporter ClcA